MRYLFFDTETTGLPRSWTAPWSDLLNWPRLVQLAWLVLDTWREDCLPRSRFIWPDGFDIPAAAAELHGITTEKALAEGRHLVDVLAEFDDAVCSADLLVCHNVAFDVAIVGSEMCRENMLTQVERLQERKTFCTMLAGTPLCRLRGGRGTYKWPRLPELYRHLFGCWPAGQHSADGDTWATAKCFFEMQRLGIKQ